MDFKQKFSKKNSTNWPFMQIVTWMASMLDITFEDHTVRVRLISKGKLCDFTEFLVIFYSDAPKISFSSSKNTANPSVTKGLSFFTFCSQPIILWFILFFLFVWVTISRLFCVHSGIQNCLVYASNLICAVT